MANEEDRRTRKDRYEDPVRISLLEDDMNHMEKKQHDIFQSTQRTNKYLILVLLTMVTVAASFAGNLLFQVLNGVAG